MAMFTGLHGDIGAGSGAGLMFTMLGNDLKFR